jgi:hypothetical protein
MRKKKPIYVAARIALLQMALCHPIIAHCTITSVVVSTNLTNVSRTPSAQGASGSVQSHHGGDGIPRAGIYLETTHGSITTVEKVWVAEGGPTTTPETSNYGILLRITSSTTSASVTSDAAFKKYLQTVIDKNNGSINHVRLYLRSLDSAMNQVLSTSIYSASLKTDWTVTYDDKPLSLVTTVGKPLAKTSSVIVTNSRGTEDPDVDVQISLVHCDDAAKNANFYLTSNGTTSTCTTGTPLKLIYGDNVYEYGISGSKPTGPFTASGVITVKVP